MSNKQIAAMIARRRAAQKGAAKNQAPAAPKRPNRVLAACIDAAGFTEHRSYAC